MRSAEEIRISIKDLIEKAENSIGEEPLNAKKDNVLSDNIIDQIQLEVIEFQNAFKDQDANGIIAQSIRETLRPILDEWIKVNLPNIVREIVEEKIDSIRKQK